MPYLLSFPLRYNEFHDLYDKLKKKFPEASSLKLPGKRFLGNNFDPSFIQSRKERLHRFVLDMVKVRDKERESVHCMEECLS